MIVLFPSIILFLYRQQKQYTLGKYTDKVSNNVLGMIDTSTKNIVLVVSVDGFDDVDTVYDIADLNFYGRNCI